MSQLLDICVKYQQTFWSGLVQKVAKLLPLRLHPLHKFDTEPNWAGEARTETTANKFCDSTNAFDNSSQYDGGSEEGIHCIVLVFKINFNFFQ